MNTIPQRWLSLSGISTVLNLTPGQVKRLYNQKFLVRIGKFKDDHRYLDPTPEYAERLRLAAVMLSKKFAGLHVDLPHSFLLTKREVAEIMGWSLRHARHFLEENKIPHYKASNGIMFYSVAAVRNLIFRRNGRGRFSKQLSPFLLPELIEFQRRFQAAEEAIVPTDEQFAEDVELQKKITWIMNQKSPEREVMLADFIQKMELAKQVVGNLRTP